VTKFNGADLPIRTPLRKVEATLPTEIADAEGVLRRSARKTVVEVYAPNEGEMPSIYELGIPVVETNDKWSYNILQKVPLNSDRDNVTPSYLREVRTLVLNAMYTEVKKEDATASWVRDASADEKASKEAVEQVMTLRFGEKRVIADPTDPEGTKLAVSQGYTVVPGGSLSGGEWANVKRNQIMLPAGQVTPSPKPYNTDGEVQKILSEDKWTPGIKKVVAYAKYVAKHVLNTDIRVKIVTDISWPFAATFGPSGELTFNVGRLGYAWFEAAYWALIDELLIHEFSHYLVSDHLSSAFHDECCRLGSALVVLALQDSEKMKALRK